MILTSRKLKIYKKVSDFMVYLKEEVKVLALHSSSLVLESQLRFSNTIVYVYEYKYSH